MGLALTIAGIVTPAMAACAVCNSYVVLTPFRANCFLDRVDVEIDRLRAGQSQVIVVDLSDCPNIGGPGSTAIALPSGSVMRPDESFVADEPMLTCLKDEVMAQMIGVVLIADDSSSMRFDLAKLCQ